MSDIQKVRYFFDESADSAKAERLLQGMIRYCEARTCRRHFLLAYFGETYNPFGDDGSESDTCCDVCSRGEIKLNDVTIPSQKYLSCVIRTRQHFGATYVIDVLMGSNSKRIKDNGDQKLSTWGIGKELSRDDWRELSDCLVDAGYLEKSMENGVLSVTAFGRKSLSSREEIKLPIEFNRKTVPAHSMAIPKNKAKPGLIDENDGEAARIATELRSWRRRRADDMNVPPYVIFGDKTLFDIANRKPRSFSALLDCYGMGSAKTQQYSDEIFRIVQGDL